VSLDVTLDIIVFYTVINKIVPIYVPNGNFLYVPMIIIYKAIKMALSGSKIKSLLNKKQSKRFDLTDRDSLSERVSEFGALTFQYR